MQNGNTFYKIPREDFCMGKGNKPKKEKVPKITEEEYAAYLSALKVEERIEEEKQSTELPHGGEDGVK